MTHEDEIEALEKQIDNLRAPLLAAHSDLVGAAATWAAEFWPDHAKEMVRTHPDVSAAKGKEGVADLRSEVQKLVDTALEHAQTELHAGHYWSHLKPDMQAEETDHSDSGGSYVRSHFRHDNDARPPELLTKPTQKLLGRVADVLRAHEYPVTWLERSRALGPEYAQYKWSPEMLAAIKEYAEFHQTLLEKQRALAAARRKRDEDAAGDLWGD